MISEHHFQNINEIIQKYISSNSVYIPLEKELVVSLSFKDRIQCPVIVIEEFAGHNNDILNLDAVQSFVAFYQKKEGGRRRKRLEFEIRRNFKTVKDVVTYGNDIEIEEHWENPANEKWKSIKYIGDTFRDSIDTWLASLNLHRCMKIE